MNQHNNKNPFENTWDEIAKTVQNQFSNWLKVTETCFDYINDNQKKMFQNFQFQFRPDDKYQITSAQQEETLNKFDESDKDIFGDNWKDHMVDAQKKWSKLTNDNLAEINGNQDKLLNILQKNYSISNKEAEEQIKDWKNACSKFLKSSKN